MAHPDKTRAGSEKGQRQHAGTTSAASDAGLKTRSQNESLKKNTRAFPWRSGSSAKGDC